MGFSSPIKNRRIGTCSDGIYTIESRVADSAGNATNWKMEKVERDSVRPDKASLEIDKNGDILQEYLSLNISGEGYADAQVKITSNYSYDNDFPLKLNSDGNYNNNQFIALDFGNITYTVKVKLTDRAGNVSEEVQASITTQECFRCATSGNGILGLPVPDDIKQDITGEFPRYKITYGGVHAGMDFASNFGTPIVASADGKVVKVTMGYPNYGKGVDDPAGWANTVIIEHNIPNYPRMQTVYAHLQNRQVVSVGQTVQRGQLIGYMGSSGASSGPHVHFQVEVEGSTLNPLHAGKFNRFPPQNPRDYLGDIEGNGTEEMQSKYCQFEGEGDTDFAGYIKIPFYEADAAIEAYLENNFNGDTEIENQIEKTTTRFDSLKNGRSNWREKVTPHDWCGVWVLDLQNIHQKNGERGFDGQIIFNPYLRKPSLVKNGVWQKFAKEKGPCGVIGVPSNLESGAGVPNGSRATKDKAFYQMFEKGVYRSNGIYAYSWKEDCGFLCTKEGFDSHFVVNKIARQFHNDGGSLSQWKFPTGDTYGDNYCKQWFEGKEIDFCYEGKIKDFVDKVNYYFDLHPPCISGGETVEGFDCRGLALLSMREVTGKSSGSFNCDKLGIGCDPKKDIPSTDVEGLYRNSFPAAGSRSNFSYTYETVAPIKGGFTIYDWDNGKDGKYDHVNIIVDVDKDGYRTWVYSRGCGAERVDDHLRRINEKDIVALKEKIIRLQEISNSDKENLSRLNLIHLTQNERNLIMKNKDKYGITNDYSKMTEVKNLIWTKSIIN